MPRNLVELWVIVGASFFLGALLFVLIGLVARLAFGTDLWDQRLWIIGPGTIVGSSLITEYYGGINR